MQTKSFSAYSESVDEHRLINYMIQNHSNIFTQHNSIKELQLTGTRVKDEQ